MKTGKGKALVGTVGLLLAVLAFALWQRHLNAIPDVSVPTPVLPSPNAFDYFVSAGNRLRDTKGVDAALSPASTVSLPAKEALVRENSPSLATLQAGFNFPYQEPPERSAEAQMPFYQKERELARLLALQSRTKAGRGDWQGAVSDDLDAVQLGEEVPHGSPLLGLLVGIACDSIGQREVWLALGHLSAQQARTDARRLDSIGRRHVSYATALQEEKWFGQAVLLERMRVPHWDDPGPYALPVSKRTAMANFTAYLDAAIADARRPYGAASTRPTPPSDMLGILVTPVFEQSRVREVDCETQNRLLQAALALRACKLEHGSYPASLASLVPSYLPDVPYDPFAPKGPLRYRRQGSGYRLYSVGPDGRDNGGQPIQHAPTTHGSNAERSRRYVLADSRGDIVAGVNF